MSNQPIKNVKLTEKEILYEDNHLLIVNKDPGILVQGDKTGDPALTDLAKTFLKKKYNKPGNVFIGLAHRIDRPVSGVVILCKTSKALTRVTRDFQSKKVKKTYLAIVKGRPPEQKGSLVNWLKKNTELNKVRVFKKETPGALRSELEYEVLAEKNGSSLLKVHPLTGRPHQIRSQLSAIGCPIAGDSKYGETELSGYHSIYLHSYRIEMIHPVTKSLLTVTASFPDQGIWKLYNTLPLSERLTT